MLQRFSCGHTTTCGFWKDDAWFETKGLCPLCRHKDRLQPTTKMVRKDDKVLIFKLARIVLK
jgi:hypothetical protein